MRLKEFDSAISFAEHMLKIEFAMRAVMHKSLGHVLTLLEEDMQKQIGEYQSGAGPYPAWATLADSTEEEKGRLGYPLNAPLLRDGELQKSFQHEQEGMEGVVGSTDPVMVYHEFGTAKMPPRPVVGPALYRNRDKIEHLLGHAMVEAIIGGTLAAGSSEAAKYLGEDIKP